MLELPGAQPSKFFLEDSDDCGKNVLCSSLTLYQWRGFFLFFPTAKSPRLFIICVFDPNNRALRLRKLYCYHSTNSRQWRKLEKNISIFGHEILCLIEDKFIFADFISLGLPNSTPIFLFLVSTCSELEISFWFLLFQSPHAGSIKRLVVSTQSTNAICRMAGEHDITSNNQRQWYLFTTITSRWEGCSINTHRNTRADL